jgi:hypothetical protein
MRKAGGMLLFGLMVLVLAIGSCGPGDTGNVAGAKPRQVFYESFDSAASIEQHGGYMMGETDDALVSGFDGSGYWMGKGNQLLYPADNIIHPEHGTIEFWVCPKTRWADSKLHHILSVGSLSAFSISKAPDSDTLRVTLHGKSIDFMEPTPMIGTVYKHQWRSGWNHVAVTWRNLGAGGQGEIVLMLNGEVRNQLVGKLPRIENHDSLILGGLASDTEPDAIIDDLRIYNESKPYWEFSTVTAPYELEPPYLLEIYPTPKPAGMLFGEGFSIDAQTKIIVGKDVFDAMLFAVEHLNDAIEQTFGYRLEIGFDQDNYSSKNFIALGTIQNNTLIKKLSQKVKLPATLPGLGSGGYILEVLPQGVAVAGADYAGSIKGLLSFRSLVIQHIEGYFPHYLMVDFPDMPFRAAEVKDAELLTDELKMRLLYFAAMGLSHVVLESEAYFDLDDETAAQRVLQVFDFARSVGLEPIPLINSLSQSSKIIAKCAEAGVDCSEGDAAHTYCPNEPYVYSVLTLAISKTIRLVHPSAIHIGHDDVRVFNQDNRCRKNFMSPAEIYVEDIDRIHGIIQSIDPGVEVMVWWDMINPLHHGSRLTAKAPGADAPDPPDILSIAPRNVTWCPYRDVNLDPTLAFVYPMLVMMELNEGAWGRYTAGPARDDIEGAYAWIRHGRDFDAIGFLHRSMTEETLPHRSWYALPAAAEFAWSYYLPFDPSEVWYDFVENNEIYGGL